jgi:8-oxo-dGTP pyrophosphatase MutT (NUDIX family)
VGHVTGSAWIVDAGRNRCLLTHHKKLNRWLQPGGHADGDADIAGVALREAYEESGLANLALVDPEIFDIDIHLIPLRQNEPEHFHYDVRFLIECGDDEGYVISEESHDLAWVPLSQIRTYSTEYSILRMVKKTP